MPGFRPTSIPLRPSPYAPIAEYGFLSDCEAIALVAPNGNVEWLCLPRPDSPSVFGSVLDRSAGGFRPGPAGKTVSSRRRSTRYDAAPVLLRAGRCVTGEVQVAMDCEPMFDYGRRPARWSYTDRGYYQGTARAEWGDGA